MNASTIARRIGSRWCCSWQVGVTLVTLGLVLSAGLTLGLGWSAYARATAVELVADAVAAAVLIAAAFTVLRSRGSRTQPFWLVLGVWIAVAAARLACAALLMPDDIGSILTFNVAIPVWALVVIYIFATIDEGRTGAREVAEANAVLLDIQEHTQDLIEHEQLRLAQAVQGQMAAEVASLRESVRSVTEPNAGVDITALADRVAAYSTQVVRTASHRLREPDAVLLGPNLQPGTARVTWPSLIDAYSRARQPIFVPAGLIAMRGLVGSLLRWDPSTLAAQALVAGVLLAAAWSGRSVIERLLPRPSAREVVASTGLVLALALIAVWGFALARTIAPANPGVIPLPAIGVFVVGVFLLSRLVSAVNLRWAQVTRELEAVNGALAEANRQLTEELARVRERLADVLHGPVQGRLAAASMALRLYADAQAQGREADLDDTLRVTTTLLDRAIQDLEHIDQGSERAWPSVEAGLEHLAQTWAGLVTVTWTTEGTSRLTDPGIALAVTLSGELVTNACRHADARRVELAVSAEDRTVEVVAINDGRPAPSSPEAGSGLGMIARHDGTWSIEGRDDGLTRVRVRVRVPMPQA